MDFPPQFFEDLQGSHPLTDYADEVDKVMVDGLSDKKLLAALGREPGTVLFTGGNLVPAELLSLGGLRFLHVHPGFLPFVRGSDGLLWSMLVRGRPGVSCFYMVPGLDEGDLIAAKEFPAIQIKLPPGPRPDDKMLYRMVFSFLDPVLRSRLLLRVLEGGADPAALPAIPQELETGITYHFMNPILRRVALDRIFTDRKEGE